jgi:uncharacterized membrane protein/YHS domain-containing protein
VSRKEYLNMSSKQPRTHRIGFPSGSPSVGKLSYAAVAGVIVSVMEMRSTGWLRQGLFSTLVAVSLLLFTIGAISVLADESPTGTGGNSYCPVTTSELIEPDIYVDWEGRRVFFCCTKCKREFLANPQQYIENLPVTSTDSVSPTADHERDVSSVSHSSDRDHQHDHASDHGESTSTLAFVGKLHPMFTHFPIALTIIAAITLLGGYVFKWKHNELMSTQLMYWAAVTSIATAALGFANAYGTHYPDQIAWFFSWHRILGIASTVSIVATALIGYRFQQGKSASHKTLYVVLIITSAILVGVTGHFGASLVFGPDYFG